MCGVWNFRVWDFVYGVLRMGFGVPSLGHLSLQFENSGL